MVRRRSHENELLLVMGELEGQISGSVHYDNVAPCFLGGLTLMAEHKEQVALQLPMFENWYWVSCYSGISVSTAAARDILPKQVCDGRYYPVWPSVGGVY